MNWIRWIRLGLWGGLLIGMGIWVNMLLTPTSAIKNEDMPRGEFVVIDGHPIHFFEKGDGPVVLLLHGFSMNSESFTPLMQYAWEKHRVIALDFPEQGYSGKQGRAYTPDGYSLTLKLFLDKLEIREVDLVGHDYGANAAMAFAANYPGMVKRMVLLAPLLEHFSSAPKGWWWRFPVLGEIWSWAFLNHTWFRQWLRFGWRSPYTSWETVVEKYYQPLRTSEGRKGFLAVLRANYDYDFSALFERVHSPTLIVFGGTDPYYHEILAITDSVRQSYFSISFVPNVGHFLMEEAPRQTYEKIKDFLNFEHVTDLK